MLYLHSTRFGLYLAAATSAWCRLRAGRVEGWDRNEGVLGVLERRGVRRGIVVGGGKEGVGGVIGLKSGLIPHLLDLCGINFEVFHPS